VAEGAVEAQVARGGENPFQLRAPDSGVEVLVGRRAIHDLGNLILLVGVVEGRCVEHQAAAQQRVLRPHLEGVDEFRLERRRRGRGCSVPAWAASVTSGSSVGGAARAELRALIGPAGGAMPGGLAPPPLWPWA